MEPQPPTTLVTTSRPASRQGQSFTYTPASTPQSTLKSSNQMAVQPVNTFPRTLNRSTTSLIIPDKRGPSSPEHPPHGRRRASSFSLQKSPAPTGKAHLSWPQAPSRDKQERSPRAPLRRQILFYNRGEPYYEFTNFSEHPVKYNGKRYPTSEHLFQSFKFLDHRPGIAEHIRLYCPRPIDALSEARRFQPEVRSDWMNVNVKKMDETLWHKFNQHPDLKQLLLSTGDAELVEDSDRDSFWGVGTNRKGRNELGKALGRLRAKLRKS